MPIYSFRDTDTEEIFEVMLSSWEELEPYGEAHPTHVRYYGPGTAPSIVSGVSITGKLDSGFKDVLSRISDAHPESPLADQHRSKSVKEVQTQRAIRKWRSSGAA